MNLKETQDWLRTLIRSPKFPSFSEERFSAGTQALTAKERLEIYRTDYHYRMVEALAETFANINRVLGPPAFQDLVVRYALEHPSQSHDLNNFGSELSEFLSKDDLTQEFPFLPDLAQMEWHFNLSFHAAYLKPIDPSSLQENLDWHNATFSFQPSFYLMKSAWPMDLLLQLKNLEDNEIDIDLTKKEIQYILVAQDHEGMAKWRRASENEYKILMNLQAGKTLGHICENLLKDDDAEEIQQCFQRCIMDGLVTHIQF